MDLKQKTIYFAAIEALKLLNKPSNLKEIYSSIIENDLYSFNAQSPINALSVMVRRYCKGIDFPTAKEPKYFQILSDGTYWIVNEPIPGITKQEQKDLTKKIQVDTDFHEVLTKIKANHKKHIDAFKQQIISRLQEMPAESFEVFSKKLLVAYGFQKMEVTQYVKDGGIDGFGQLKVGMTHLNVAFQSKRWKNNSVSRVEIDKFRGAIQGEYEQGIIFTTSKFTKDALSATRKPGAVPIILIDGESLVDIMIEKRFGIDIENLPIYINALDNVLND